MDYQAFHKDLIVVDGHCDSLLDHIGRSFATKDTGARNLLEKSDERGHLDIPRLIEAGVTGQFFAMFTADEYLSDLSGHNEALLAAYEELVAKHPRFQRALCAQDILDAKAAGNIAAFLSIEGGELLGESLDTLRRYYDKGVRQLGLTWNRQNAIASGAGAKNDYGLSDFGKKLIDEMEKLGMLIDVSHLSPKSLSAVLDRAQRPLVASHSNAWAVNPHRRNLNEKEAERIAETGGLIGITFAGVFLDPDPEKVSLEKVLEHLDSLFRVVGEDHIGLGSDFDGYTTPYGTVMEDCTGLSLLTKALLERDYSQAAVQKIMGENWLRVLSESIS